ncbi:hypothetical protein [Mucilaginibacter puniceus]
MDLQRANRNQIRNEQENQSQSNRDISQQEGQHDREGQQRANREQNRSNQESQSGSNRQSSQQEGQNDRVDQQWTNRDQNRNNQESQSQSGNMSNQEGQNKRPVYIKDMPEIKPETNQGGV